MLGFQIVAAISGVQSARLLETSPKGWQSSGSLEDKNYSKLLLSIQNADFCPILNMHYKLLAKSLYDIEKEYTCVFEPIDTPTEKERAEIKEINSRTDMNYIQAGVVSPDEVRGVLREDVNSGYNALSEEIEETENPFGNITEENENIKSETNETENQSGELLNGAQVTSMINIASAVGEGRMSRGTGVNILKTAFGLSPEQAENLIEKTDNDEPRGSSNGQSPFKSLDEWNESEHPRKENGQFGKGGENIEKSAKCDKIKEKQRKEIQLPKDEYAQVIHELNTNLTKEERKKKQITKCIGNCFYTILNNGFNEYKIIGKQNIDDIYN